MNVSLTPELEKLIHERVDSGLYNSASEVVREALRLLEEQDRIRKLRLEELKKQIDLGIDQLDRGEFSEHDQKSLDQLQSKIKSRGRKRRARRNSKAKS